MGLTTKLSTKAKRTPSPTTFVNDDWHYPLETGNLWGSTPPHHFNLRFRFCLDFSVEISFSVMRFFFFPERYWEWWVDNPSLPQYLCLSCFASHTPHPLLYRGHTPHSGRFRVLQPGHQQHGPPHHPPRGFPLQLRTVFHVLGPPHAGSAKRRFMFGELQVFGS